MSAAGLARIGVGRRVLMVLVVMILPLAGATSAEAAADPSPGTYTGQGFDTCSAPSSDVMNAWLASPYQAVGIYFGGQNRACTQPNLTPSWVAAQQDAGWHLIPIYLGLQAPCTTSTKPFRIDPASSASQGTAQAEDAVTQARTLGLPPESVLFFDMEAYRTDDAICRSAVLTFIGAWTHRLHDLGYLSGFYSSMASGVADQVANYNTMWYAHPDYLYFARWDGVATVSHPDIPSSYWYPHRRIKQYQGDHNETWGGVTMAIDNDYLDVAPIPASPFGDFNGNRWPDLLARQVSNGGLYLYPGDGTWFGGGRTATGLGWDTIDAITRLGDINRDGFEDVFGREKATGYLWLYTGNGTTFTSKLNYGAGWNTVREITAIGDFDRDGFNDVVAADIATGALFLYTGNGTTFTSRRTLGSGWNTVDELAGVGDFNGDGYVDLVARDRSTGALYLYTGAGTTFSSKRNLGAGWETLRDLVGIGDFNRDGYTDLLGIEKATGILFLYTGAGSGLTSKVNVGAGWAGLQPIL
jgi:hypothetical protein